jgi:hypothetical protein
MPGNAMKRLIAAAFALAVLSGPLYAQDREDPVKLEKKQEADRIESQYKAALKRMDKTNETTANDPWANMRGTGNSKTDSKTKH